MHVYKIRQFMASRRPIFTAGKIVCVFCGLQEVRLPAISLGAAACGNSWAQQAEGLASTPQMGWNSWNKFACEIDERLIRETADAMA
jgi:hypothetical protein